MLTVTDTPRTDTPRAAHVAPRAADLAAAIRSGAARAADVLDEHLARIAQHNPQLNAIVVLDAERARAEARAADAALARGECRGPLHGVPVTVKDTYDVAELPTPNGFARPRPATEDATVVARLRAAGAVVVGKTNVPLAAYDWQCRSPVYGLTRNPWDHDRTPGGSGGGGGAAVAAGLTPIDLGSDVAGSIRVPAHFCGIFGLKPTEHRVSDAGHARIPGRPRTLRSMVTLGPLARSVADLRLAFEVVAGPDPRRPTVPPVVESDADVPPVPRIAWAAAFDGIPTSGETRAVLASVAACLTRAGMTVEARLPAGFDAPALAELWGRVNGAEVGASGPAAMRVAFGLGASPLLGASRLTRGLRRGALGGVVSYLHALAARDEATSALDAFFDQYDALLCPVAGVPAITHRRTGTPIDVDGGRAAYSLVLGGYCTPFSLTGHPVVVLPAGRTADGMPIGVQLVGHRWRDLDLLALAERVEQALRPDGRSASTD